MKFALTVLTLVFPLTTFAAHPWTDVVGCYKTLTHNGAAVDTNGAQSSIKDVDDLAVIHDAKGGTLGGLEMMIIQGYDKAADEMRIDYQAALTGRGEYTTDASSKRIFTYSGFIRFQDMPPMMVKARVAVLWLAANKLQLETKREVPGTGGGYDTNDVYTLQKTDCQ